MDKSVLLAVLVAICVLHSSHAKTGVCQRIDNLDWGEALVPDSCDKGRYCDSSHTVKKTTCDPFHANLLHTETGTDGAFVLRKLKTNTPCALSMFKWGQKNLKCKPGRHVYVVKLGADHIHIGSGNEFYGCGKGGNDVKEGEVEGLIYTSNDRSHVLYATCGPAMSSSKETISSMEMPGPYPNIFVSKVINVENNEMAILNNWHDYKGSKSANTIYSMIRDIHSRRCNFVESVNNLKHLMDGGMIGNENEPKSRDIFRKQGQEFKDFQNTPTDTGSKLEEAQRHVACKFWNTLQYSMDVTFNFRDSCLQVLRMDNEKDQMPSTGDIIEKVKKGIMQLGYAIPVIGLGFQALSAVITLASAVGDLIEKARQGMGEIKNPVVRRWIERYYASKFVDRLIRFKDAAMEICLTGKVEKMNRLKEKGILGMKAWEQMPTIKMSEAQNKINAVKTAVEGVKEKIVGNGFLKDSLNLLASQVAIGDSTGVKMTKK